MFDKPNMPQEGDVPKSYIILVALSPMELEDMLISYSKRGYELVSLTHSYYCHDNKLPQAYLTAIMHYKRA